MKHAPRAGTPFDQLTGTTWPRGNPPHGTRARYGAPHNCRCEPCRQANANYLRERRRAQEDRS